MSVKATSIDAGRTFKRDILENVSFIETILLTFVIALEVLECKFWSRWMHQGRTRKMNR